MTPNVTRINTLYLITKKCEIVSFSKNVSLLAGFWPFGQNKVGHSLFGLAAIPHLFGRKWQGHRSFHYEGATSFKK